MIVTGKGKNIFQIIINKYIYTESAMKTSETRSRMTIIEVYRLP